MMFYYIDKIEQVEAAEDFPWTVNEYGSRKQYKETLPEVRARYFTELANISNDLKEISEDKKHYYAHVQLINSDGGVEEEKVLGTRVEPERRPEPEPVQEG